MTIYYFDSNGEYMTMESNIPETVTIPVIVRKYEKFDTYTTEFDFIGDVPITAPRMKYQNDFKYFNYSMTLDNFTGVKADWKIDYPDIPEVVREIDKKLDYWFRKRCRYSEYLARPDRYNRAHTCFWFNESIASCKGLTVHTYGNCTIRRGYVTDCLIFNHGNLKIED